MSPHVLTTGATITCPHGGTGTTTPTSTAWTVNGNPVVRAGDTGTLSCGFIVPCGGYLLRSMGLNATLLEGLAVVLETDVQQSLTGLPLLVVDAHTTIDDSTPAPLPPPGSGPAPDRDPALDDTTPPVVTVTPPSAAFTTSLMSPAVLPFTFVLTHAFPLSWRLVVLNTTAQTSLDLTAGSPPAAVVVPPGGTWDSPQLTVVVTLTAAFLAGLGPATHDLYLTGVSRRGLSGHARATVVVSP
jgi:hypothetical protein